MKANETRSRFPAASHIIDAEYFLRIQLMYTLFGFPVNVGFALKYCEWQHVLSQCAKAVGAIVTLEKHIVAATLLKLLTRH